MRKVSNATVIILFLLVFSFGFWWLVGPTKDLALVNASANGDTNAVLTLVKGGANIDWSSKQTGETALIAAASNGREEVVRTLLSLGAKEDIRDHTGRTARDNALAAGWTNLANLLTATNAIGKTRQPE